MNCLISLSVETLKFSSISQPLAKSRIAFGFQWEVAVVSHLVTGLSFFKAMASNSSLGAAMGGEGTADKIPGRSLPTLVLGRLGYPTGGGAPRLVSAEWRGETERLYGRELAIQVALRDPHNELLTHYLNSAVAAGDIDEARRLIGAGASPNVEVCRFDERHFVSSWLIEEPSLMFASTIRE